ncbi:hypothetical protein L208DRAFT_1284998 [Tricholoma matsutake]|nr:hypothetical protein L208DRAFT_1284998 [Tricholoma matsutake 945]
MKFLQQLHQGRFTLPSLKSDGALISKLQNAESYVESLENSLNIEEQWTAASPEYQSFYQQTVQRSYEHALDKLECLVVMQLFELMKMSTSGTGMPHLSNLDHPCNFLAGYKLCHQIRKALQHHLEAIKNMLNCYNVQAAKLMPPCPSLSWKEIVDYSFLGEFDVLRYSQVGIHDQPWAQATCCKAMVKYFKLCCAQEE